MPTPRIDAKYRKSTTKSQFSNCAFSKSNISPDIFYSKFR